MTTLSKHPVRWAIAGWVLFSFVGLNLHQWALRNRDVAESLLIVYAAAIWAIATWRLALWADRLAEQKRKRLPE